MRAFQLSSGLSTRLCEHAFLASEIASLGADFQRAVQQGNVMRAEAAARQLGQLPLESALRLLLLYAEKEPIKFERAALRWLARYVTKERRSRCSRRSSLLLRWGSYELGSVRLRPSY
jgi:hypothetical protein